MRGVLYEIYQPTLKTLLFFAFVQVALVEECAKWIAFKCAGYMRGKRRKSLDHPYAIMFYSALISAAFSIVENIQYAQRAAYGAFGNVTPENVLIVRSVTSVIIHMACGLFMGYYIALAKNSSIIKKILYTILGIGAATFIHGIYDFNCMKPGSENDYYNLFGSFPINLSALTIIVFSIIIAFLMSWNLKYVHKNELKRKEKLSHGNDSATL